MFDAGIVKPGSTIRIPFSSFNKTDGSSITMTNFLAADILVYKDGNTTERASTSGYTATTDFDAKTGKHLITIDLADNTTAGFWNAGSEYTVAVDAVTVDSVTVGGWVARFRIGYSQAILDTTIATLASQTSMTLTVGPAENNALVGYWAIIHNIASAVQCSKVLITAYTGSTKTITLSAGASFTAAAGDNISIIELAPLQAATIGRALVVDAAGLADANVVKLGPTGAGTAQTARDIGLSVLISSGTGTGQLSVTSGVIAGNVTQYGGVAGTFTGGRPEVNTSHWGGTVIASATVRADLINIAGAAVSTSTAQLGVNVVNFGGAAGTFAAGRPEVNVSHFGGTAGTFAAGRPEVNTTHWAGTAVASATVRADLINIAGAAVNTASAQLGVNVVNAAGTAWGSGAITAAVLADNAIDRATFAADTGFQSVRSNTAQAGAAGTITLDASASATTDFYVGSWVYLTGGTGVGQARLVTAYNGTTKVATIRRNWATNPDNTSTFAICSAADVMGVVLADTITTYTGNTVQTGDSFARIGATGSGLTSLAPSSTALSTVQWTNGRATNLDNLDAAVSSRMATFTLPTNFSALDINVSGHITRVVLVDTLTTYTGNTVQTGDSFARIGANGAGLTSIVLPSNGLSNVTAWTVNITGNLSGSVGSVTNAVSLSAGDSAVLQSGTATAGGASTITIQTAIGADSLPVGCTIKITSGTGAKQSRVITAYVDATKVVTVDRPWTINPDNTSVYTIVYNHAPALSTGLKVTGVVLTDTLTTYTGNTVQTGDSFARIGSTGSGLTSLAPSSTALSTAQWTNTLATNIGTTNSTVATNLDTTVSSRSTLTQTQVTGGAYALNSSSFAFNTALDFTTTQKAATLARVTLVDTITTYTGNTVQTGDSFARIGATGSGLTSLAPSSTALSTANWTNARAGYLDNLSAGAVALASGVTVSSGGINRASYATDTGHQSIRSNTAQAGAGTSITLDASASAIDNFYNNDLILITSGTGVGQSRFITAYNGTTKVATVSAWSTNPDNTSTFAITGFDSVPGATAPTASQVATAVWTDLLASSDFSTSASIGKLLKDDIDATISSRMATFTLPTNFSSLGINGSGHISRVTLVDTITTYTGDTPQTGDSFARIGATGSGLTSLAPSSTALSTANWSNTRAGYLDNLSGGAVALASGVSVSSGGINRASFATDTGLQTIRSNTAQSGGGTTITLDAGASSIDDFYNNCLILLTSGTGIGQGRFITDYNGTTKTATVGNAWSTNPDNTSTFAITAFDSIPGATAPTAAQVATAVWTDLLAGSDFSTASSIGKLLKDNVDTTISSRSTYAGADTAGTTTLLSRLTSGRAGNLDNLDATISSRMATFTLPTNFSSLGINASGHISRVTLTDTVTTLTTTPSDSSGVTTLLSRLTSGRATNLDNLDAAISTRMATFTLPTNFSALGINASGHVSRVVLVDTLTTYTGNTVQTGDSFARIGATGSGLTSLAPSSTALSTAQWTNTRAGFLDNLDAAISSRMATFTLPTNFSALGINVSGHITRVVLTDTTTNLTNAATGDSSGVTTLLSRLTSGRATNLDNLDATTSSRMATFTLPTNFASLGINASGHISRVVLADTVTTYTGNTPQTGDSFARIGSTGSALTSLAQATGVPLSSGQAETIADTVLNRNLAGGSSGGTRTVKNALRPSINKVVFDLPVVGKFTVYQEDDITVAWVGNYVRGNADEGALIGTDAD